MTALKQQLLLKYLDFQPGELDGIDGPETNRARKAFEAAYGVGCTEGNLIAAVCGALGKPETKQDTKGTFWDRIKYFQREEFRCPCGNCGGFTVEPDCYTVEIADEIREELKAPMTIVPLTGDPHGGGSGVRCQAYNDSLSGSVSNSWHTKGKAFDFMCWGRSATVIEYVLQKKKAQGKVRYWYKCGTACWHVDTGGIN